jgi:electron-transferring-flavoprotein dehydrogenase
MAHALIAGCGDVGTRAGLLLAEAGWQVTGLRRAGVLPAPMQVHHADLTNPASLTGLASDIDLLLYLPTPASRDAAGYRAIFVDGLANLLAALPRRPLRLVFVSSTAVYGEHHGAWADEDTPTRPLGFNGEILLQAERALAACGVPAVIARLAGIYGPGREWMLERVRQGATCRPDAWTNRIHVGDAARLLVHVSQLAQPAPCYLGVDDLPAVECEVMEWLAQRMGVDPPQHGPGAASMALGNKRLSNARLRATGFTFQYPDFRCGYAGLTPPATSGD